MRIELIANPRSGKGAGPRLAEAVAAALRQQGHEVATHLGLNGEDAARWAREKSATADRLAVLGGDGTLSAILPGLPEKPPPLAFLPLGTSNLVAHELGLPRKPAGIARLIEDGEIQEIDLGSVNGRPSFLVWDFGAGGELMRRMEESRSGPIRKSQYLAIGWKMMREWRSPPQRVIADGEDLGEFEFGIVAGLPLYASWMLRLGPATYDDGLWELYLIRRFGLWDALRLGLAALFGRVHRARGVLHRRVKTVSVRGEAPAPIQVDGDFGGTTPVEFALESRKLPLLVPRK